MPAVRQPHVRGGHHRLDIPRQEGLSQSKCFVATACYGSPDCPEVLALRRFRDERLLTSALGRLLVDAYYALSPPVARFVGARPTVRHRLRAWLIAPLARRVAGQEGRDARS